MAVWLSGSLRKNCFSSPSTNDTIIVEANMAENVLEEVVVIRLEEMVVEMRARRMMISIIMLRMATATSTASSHFSLFTDHETNILSEIKRDQKLVLYKEWKSIP